MTRTSLTMPLAAALLLGLSGSAFAWGGGGGNGDSGSGLNPYSALSGNDRSAGVNNGNYTDPAYNTYLRAYDPRQADRYAAPPGPQPQPRLRMRPYYGYPY